MIISKTSSEGSILTSSNAPDLWFARTTAGYDHRVAVHQGAPV
jgi:hypothetical protein